LINELAQGMVSMNNEHMEFESLVRSNFSFLELERGMVFSGVKEVGKGDPRDVGLLASYRKVGLKVDVGWSDVQKSVTVLIHIANEELPGRMRHLYLDSFVEFSSAGAEKSVVAQIFPRMSEAGILKVMKERERLFKGRTLSEVLFLLADKLSRYFDEIAHLSAEKVVSYHDWMGAK
jgi:hypothetical protein